MIVNLWRSLLRRKPHRMPRRLSHRPRFVRERLKALALVIYNMCILYVLSEVIEIAENAHAPYLKTPSAPLTWTSRPQWLGGMMYDMRQAASIEPLPEFSDWNGRFHMINNFVNIFMILILIMPHRSIGVYSFICVFWNIVVCAKIMHYSQNLWHYATMRARTDPDPVLTENADAILALCCFAPLTHLIQIVSALDFCKSFCGT